MLDFELLRAFVAVVDCGGFHRAAERLNLTQSTVSQQIKRLELETKRPLFRRTTRSVALTDDGEMLLGDERRLLQFEEAARHRLPAARNCSSNLMRGGLTSCSQSARSEPRKGVWCGVSRWSGPRPTRSILFQARRCRWPCIASDPFLARLHSPRSTTTN